MPNESINEVLADNLRYYMQTSQGGRLATQQALATAAGLAQTTVSLYLNPSKRKPGKTGKPPSAKLGEVERFADALGPLPRFGGFFFVSV